VLEARRSSVVAVSPIIGGRALKGPADRLLGELGLKCRHRVAAHLRDVIGSIVIDVVDAELATAISALDVSAVVTETIMRTPRSVRSSRPLYVEAGREVFVPEAKWRFRSFRCEGFPKSDRELTSRR